MADSSENEPELELKPDDQPVRAAPVLRPVPAIHPTVPAAQSHPNRKLDYQAPKPGAAEPEAIKNLYMPLWILGIGCLVQIVGELLIDRRNLATAGFLIFLMLGLRTALALGALFITARFRGILLGSLPHALLKLAAISVAPGAVLTLMFPVMFIPLLGPIIAYTAAFVVLFALLGALFDLEPGDTWYFLAILFVIYVGVFFLAMAIH